MHNLTESRVLEAIKNYYPKFEGHPWNVKIDIVNKKINLIESKISSIYGQDLLFQLLEFEKVNSDMVLYHYRPTEYVPDIRNGITRIDSLNKYLNVVNGDKEELSAGIKTFYKSIDTTTNSFTSFKKGHYIFCLTDKYNSEYHYKEFGPSCIRFRYQPLISSSLVNLYKVKYLDDLNTFLELREDIWNKYKMELSLKSSVLIAPFVKSEKYRVESEYRLMFNTHQEKVNKLLGVDQEDSHFLDNLNRNELYLEIPLINPLFKLTVEEIMVRKN